MRVHPFTFSIFLLAGCGVSGFSTSSRPTGIGRASVSLLKPSVSNDVKERSLDRPDFAVGNAGRTRLESVTVESFSGSVSNNNPLRVVTNAVHSLSNSLRTSEVARWRALAFTFCSYLFLFHKSIDAKLEVFWKFLMTSQSLPGRIFRSDSWEWGFAVTCFAVYIHGFWLADRAVRKADEQGRVHPWKKYRLQDRFEADKHRRMVEKRSSSLASSFTPANATEILSPLQSSESPATVNSEPPLVTKQSKWNVGGWGLEFWLYVLPLLTWDILAPRRHRRLAPFGAPTTFQMVGGIVGGLLFYDFLFFCGHVLMHKIPFIYRTVHAKHHKTQEVRAGEIVRLSAVEEILEVGFSIIGLNLLSVHPLARTIYNAVITFLLTELHCGFDFPWQPQSVVPFGIVTGSRRHHYHHRFGKHYYQKFFFTVDRLFGFFQKDDGSLQGDSVKPDPYIPPSWASA